MASGAINAVAGGGSLISFPVLVASGLPALSANVSNTVGQCPGYVTAVVGYRRELRGQGTRMRQLGAAGLAGAGLGIGLLEVSSAATFEAVVPWLVLLASLLLAVQPALARRLAVQAEESGGPRPLLLAAIFAAATYGAYFGAALGVMLLAALALLLADRLQRLNALNRWLSLVINAVAAVAFAAAFPVDWSAVAALAPTTLVGARVGVVVARRLSDRLLRAIVVTCGLAATAYLAAQ